MINFIYKTICFLYTVLLFFGVFPSSAQTKSELNPETPPVNIGGKLLFDHTVKTQLFINPNYIWKDEKNVTVFFTVSKEGKVSNPFFKEQYDAFYTNECKRMLNYFEFEPAVLNGKKVDAYASLTFNFNGSKYDESLKERKKNKKLITKPQDSTFTVYETADKSPEFYKGDDNLAAFILENIEYPSVAKNQNIEGTVQLSFIVETNGFISNINILRGVNGGCNDESVRVALLTKWKPAEKNGKLVRYRMNFPITFNLKNVNKDHSMGGQ